MRGYRPINFNWATGVCDQAWSSTTPSATASSIGEIAVDHVSTTPATATASSTLTSSSAASASASTDSLFVDLDRLRFRRRQRRSDRLRPVHHAPDRLHLRRRQRLLGLVRRLKKAMTVTPSVPSSPTTCRTWWPARHTPTGILGVSAVAGYDSDEEEFAIKGRLDVTPSDMFSLFVMGAWTDDERRQSGGNYYASWGGDWAIWAGGAIHVQRAHHAQWRVRLQRLR